MFCLDGADAITIRFLCLKYDISQELTEKLLEEFPSVKHEVLKELHRDEER